MGINDVMVTCFRNQYKQRHNTLKKALKEVEDTYGMKVSSMGAINQITALKDQTKDLYKEKRDKARKRMSLFKERDRSEENGSDFRAAVRRAFDDNYHAERTPKTPESGRRLMYNPEQSSFDGDISK